MRHKRVRQLRELAAFYYIKRINSKVVPFARFFRRVKQNYNRHGIKTVQAMLQVIAK